MDKVYVGIKDNIVLNTIIIDDENLSLIEIIKSDFNFDYLIPCNDNQVSIGWLYDGENVYDPNYIEELPVENTEES